MEGEFEISNKYIRGCMIYDFKAGLKAIDCHRRLCSAFGQGVVSYKTVTTWYTNFQSGNWNIEDEPRSGRPSEIDDQALLQLIEMDPRQSTRQMATSLGCNQSTIVRHLESLGKVQKLGCWLPHKLTDRDREQRVTICSFLLSYSRTTGWFNSIVTGDEKWVLYVNVARRHQWVDQDAEPEPEAKPGLHQKKVMLCVWWSVRGVIHYELLPPNTTVTASYYCNQLESVNSQLEKMRPKHGKVRFLHDNARPHTASLTKDKLKELDWEVLPHPPYSPDLAPSDYYLFRSLHNFLRDKEYKNRDEVTNDIEFFFSSKSEEFYREGISKLLQRWQQVVDSDGEYIVD